MSDHSPILPCDVPPGTAPGSTVVAITPLDDEGTVRLTVNGRVVEGVYLGGGDSWSGAAVKLRQGHQITLVFEPRPDV